MSDALDLFREHDQPLGEVWTLVNLASIAAGLRGDLDSARDQYERALAIATDIGQAALRGTVLAELAGNALARGDHEAARVQLREAIELEREGGDVYYTASHITDAAWVEIVAGDVAGARRILVDAIHAGIETEDAWQLREALVVVSMLYLNEGRPSDAGRVLAATGWDAEAQHPECSNSPSGNGRDQARKHHSGGSAASSGLDPRLPSTTRRVRKGEGPACYATALRIPRGTRRHPERSRPPGRRDAPCNRDATGLRHGPSVPRRAP